MEVLGLQCLALLALEEGRSEAGQVDHYQLATLMSIMLYGKSEQIIIALYFATLVILFVPCERVF